MRRGKGARALIVTAVVPLMAFLAGGEASGAPSRPDLHGNALTPSGRVQADKSPTSRLAQTDKSLLGRTDDAPVDVVIKLDYDSLATYNGGVRGMAPTSPSVTGKPLAEPSEAKQRYEAHIAGREQAFTAELTKRVPQAKVGQSLRLVYGGVAALVPANRISDVVGMDEVVAVQKDSLHKPTTDSSPQFLGADAVYRALGTTSNAGQGVIFGSLDTGVWPEHPAFADRGDLPAPPPKPDRTPRVCNFGDNPLTPADDPYRCNRKLIGGQPFLATYLSNPERAAAEPFQTARDSNGHGTHTSSTAAGNIVTDVTIQGGPNLGPIHGMAPGAWVVAYKVCGIQGCYNSDSAAAVGQAILDGVNVINFSISGGTQPFSDPVELAFLDAYAAGVFVSTSAGNEGPGAGTVNHLSPWVSTVAASTQRREFATTLTVTAGNGESFVADGASIMPGAGPAPTVLASELPEYHAQCRVPAPAGTFAGKIVACERGFNARVDKGYNVLQGGAVGMVLYNPTLADVETDTHWLPTVHLADGRPFLAFMNGHTGEVASFPGGARRDGRADVMAAFSSRGPAGLFIKPDVAAPGVQILAGDSPCGLGSGSPCAETTAEGPPGQYFQAIAGTSMSAPLNAGAAILTKAVNRDWTPGQIKSSLMTTATTDVVKEDLTTPANPFDFGAGRIDLNRSWKPGLTFDETAARMIALGNDPINAVHLNIPSVNVPVMPGRVSTIRTAKNVSGLRQQYNVETTAQAGSKITVLPRRFTLDPGQSVQVSITIESTAPAGQQFFGQIRLVPARGGYPTLHLPVAFVTGQGSVSLMSNCGPTQVPLQGVSTCEITAQNNAFDPATVNLTTTVNRNLRVVGADNAFVVDSRTVRKPNVTLSAAQPGVPSVGPGTTPAGYLPLDQFGISPVPIGDEEIINFGVPQFVYNGKTYNSIGVDSNGYIVAGGASAEDNNCCNLPNGPSPERPNNVLAPFWTDLDGTGAPGILAGELTSGTDSWIVVEYRVNVFGTNSLRVFQVWIGEQSTQDISFTYDPANLPADPNGQDFLVGAENEIGQGDMEAVLPATDLMVTSTAPVPGGSVTYSVSVRGVRPGVGVVTTEMEGPTIPGTTIVKSEVTVGAATNAGPA